MRFPSRLYPRQLTEYHAPVRYRHVILSLRWLSVTCAANDRTKMGKSVYKQLAELPTYRAAQFQGKNVIRAITSTSDHIRSIKRQAVRSFTLNKEDVSTSLAPDTPEIIASHVSPSGRLLAVFREVTASEGKKRYVEVWSEGTLHASHDVSSIHADFYTDEYMASISFSPSENQLVYTAERKPDDQSDEDEFAKYRFQPNFGELYNGKKEPNIFLFNFANDDTSVLPLSIGQRSSSPVLLCHAIFATEDRIYATGYEYSEDGRLLGVIYCPNRRASIWELTLPDILPSEDAKDKHVKCSSLKITTPDRSCRSPRVFYRDGKPQALVWLSNAVGGPHASCSSLHVLDLGSREERTLVSPVWDPHPDEFPGLYVTTLPPYPFLELPSSDGVSDPHVLVTSTWRSRSTIVSISLTSGKVTDLSPEVDGNPFSWSLLCTDGAQQIVGTRSSLSTPPEILLGNISLEGAKWTLLAKPDISEDLRKRLDSLEISVLPIPERHPTEAIVLKTKGSSETEEPAAITVVHGGPHSAVSTGFNATNTAFALEGYIVSMPNYTGSTGYGEKYIKKLLGQIGRLDVDDCIASVRYLVEQGITSAGPNRQFLSGGSHGGFLLGHLIGRFPDGFGGAAIRNPVMSLGEMSTTDIPDWYYEEGGLPYSPGAIVTPEIYERLYGMSPVAYVDRVKTPVLLLLGEKDQRVAPTNARNYYHALKARGKEVDMLCFKDDSHPLDSVDALRIGYEASKQLFDKVRDE